MLTIESINSLKVAELKDELKKRNLSVSGKKADLLDRLRRATIESGAPSEAYLAQTVDIGDEVAVVTDGKEPPVPETAEATMPAEPASNDAKNTRDAEVSAANGFGLITQAVPEPVSTEAAVPRKAQALHGSVALSVRKEAGKKRKSGQDGGEPQMAGRRQALTIADIFQDPLSRLAQESWSVDNITSGNGRNFDAILVDRIYVDELGGGTIEPAVRCITLLEISQYLENYLWPGYRPQTATLPHFMSILLMVNEKCKEGNPAWACFEARKNDFKELFAEILSLPKRHPFTHVERMIYLDFLMNAYQSLENEMVRNEVLRLVGLPLWHALSPGRLQVELHNQPLIAKHWKSLAKREAKAKATAGATNSEYVPVEKRPEAQFFPWVLADFLGQLSCAVSEDTGLADSEVVRYCERFVRFLSDLLSQLPTRRFVHAVLDDQAILVKCYISALYRSPSGILFAQLVNGLRSTLSFPIDDHTGDELHDDAVVASHYERVQQLQRLLFKHWPKLRDAALTNCGTLEKRDVLSQFLGQLSPDELRLLVTRQLRIVNEADPAVMNGKTFLTEVMITAYERRESQKEVIEAMPLYPTEEILLDDEAVPAEGSSGLLGSSIMLLPRLNLQFLTLNDYLVRNFHLFRLEAAYEIREDVADVIRRVAPYIGEDSTVHYSGWSRMAQPLQKFMLIEVRKPRVGESCPAAVTAEVIIDTRLMRSDVAAEWDRLKQHDVLFLLSISPPDIPGQRVDWEGARGSALRTAGLQYARGCEVIEIRDENKKLMNDFTGRVQPDERGPPNGTVRTLTVALDPTQYQMDVEASVNGQRGDVYGSFNLLMRRHAKENNYKAVLESIRDLVGDEEAAAAMPSWLHDVILGYGDPKDALHTSMDDDCLHTVDFKDTFLDAEHLVESFPQYKIDFEPAADAEAPHPPFKVKFPSFSAAEETASVGRKGKRRAGDDTAASEPSPPPRLSVESYSPADPGPYPQDIPPQNTVRYTPAQVQAILSGVQPGLTMVVGPPGTGKTDTAVQIMHILYQNCPSERTLVITHSNQALNDLFQKVVERDVLARYLLRLGMGEADLDTEEEFSRVGRVNAMLARRLELLAEVQRLAVSLKVTEAVAYTCETAGHFWLLHVLSRWEKFSVDTLKLRTGSAVSELFPFKEFFADAAGQLFGGEDFHADWSRAQGCFRHLQTLFQELEEIRPFEVLKSQRDRINYLLTKQAKVVAMTCTHAALKRREFLELGFTYDNLLMEEAAQVLEIETTLPLLLQRAEDGRSRLKRVVLIGDHHQLPPVVKNTALQKWSRMDQSLFSRLVRLGACYIELDAQGRSRPSIAALYNWRYRNLGDLPRVSVLPEFRAANAGFAFEYQLIDVPDFLGRGENEPVAYFYQNLGEAEYLVSVYQYMRLLGYPASSIAILTTYNGQRALLHDVVERRCASHPLFGRPSVISTVDKYQGQQSDYVLLSLVRTRHFGHLRDVRRLVVALSRARLGLYIFARAGLFANCFELQPAFRHLMTRPLQLALVAGEQFGGTARPVEVAPPEALLVEGVEHMASIVQQMGSEWEMRLSQGGNMPIENDVQEAWPQEG